MFPRWPSAGTALSLGDIPGLGPASYLVLITWWLVGACTSTVPVGTLCGCFAHSPPVLLATPTGWCLWCLGACTFQSNRPHVSRSYTCKSSQTKQSFVESRHWNELIFLVFINLTTDCRYSVGKGFGSRWRRDPHRNMSTVEIYEDDLRVKVTAWPAPKSNMNE